jgi:glycosyltransferase involved in cell wall biosynthesis
MKVTIALAVYNGAAYIREQLESFVAQTYRPDELVISDDGSTDRTLDIINEFAAFAPFPVTCSQNQYNLSYAGNFNAALMQATGDLVFLSDQDDVWFPEKIERIVALAKAEPQKLVFMNDAVLTDVDLNDTGLTKLDQIYSVGLTENSFVMGCCSAVRRDLLDICLPIPAGVAAHDNWIMGIADGLGRKRILPEVLQYYRRHGSNESQCIVNRTSRVTRKDVLLGEIAKYLCRFIQSSQSVTRRGVQALTIQNHLLLWACEAVERSPNWLQADIARYKLSLERHVQAINQLHAIRSLPFTRRACFAFTYWCRGTYREFSGIQSALRDVLCPND